MILYKTIINNLANFVSISGAISVFILIYSATPYTYSIIATFVLLADDLDGIIARKTKTNKSIGIYIDLICDSIAHGFLFLFVINFWEGKVLFFASVVIFIMMIFRLAKLCHHTNNGNVKGATTNEHILTICLIISSESITKDTAPTLLILTSLLPILSWNLSEEVTTIRRLLTPCQLIFSNLILLISCHFPILSLLFLLVHIFIYSNSLVHIYWRKFANEK